MKAIFSQFINFSFFIAIIFYGSLGICTLKLTDAQGVSVPPNLTPTQAGEQTIIRGGWAPAGNAYLWPGVFPDCPANQPCNTCRQLTGTPLACNYNSINPNVLIRLTFASDSNSGVLQLTDGTNILESNLGFINTSGPVTISSLTWGDICGYANNHSDCSEAFKKTFYFQIDTGTTTTDSYSLVFQYGLMDPATDSLATPGGDGVQDFTLFPGDKKAYVIDAVLNNYSFKGNKITALRAFFASSGFSGDPGSAPLNGGPCLSEQYVLNNSDSYEMDLDETTKEIVNNSIREGLNNDTNYIFRMAVQDEIGNIGFFTNLTPASACDPKKHSVTPREVYGLLEKNMNCFIATAAFGSPLNKHVKTFRSFRDHFLKKSKLGRAFIAFYYKNSPPIAETIREHEFLKTLTRTLLWPLWLFSLISLKIGLFNFSLVLASLGALLFYLFRKRKSFGKLHKYFLKSFFLKKNLIQRISSEETFENSVPLKTTAVFTKNPLHFKKTKIFLFILLSMTLLSFSYKAYAQDEDFFDYNDEISETTQDATQNEMTPQKDAPPNEPPYTDSEIEEEEGFNETPDSYAEDLSEPDTPDSSPQKNYKENYFESKESNPKKWAPYKRVPSDSRLDELSKEGLTRITKKGEFIYDVPSSPQNHAASLRFAQTEFLYLDNGNNVSFDKIYGEEAKMLILFDYEWQFFQSFGKLGLKFGSGLMLAGGYGQLSYPVTLPDGSTTTESEDRYNLYLFPNSVSLTYRLDIFHNQWVVPFADAGLDYFAFFETKNGAETIKLGGAPHFHYAFGGSFLLDVLGRDMMKSIDRDYGVNHLWLTGEYRRIEALTNKFDFSSDVYSAGLTVEF